MKKNSLLIAAVTLGSLLLSTGCGHKEASHEVESRPAATVNTGRVERLGATRAQWLPGTVHPADQAVIAAKLMATVEQADFTIGQSVEEGDVLVTLAADEIDAQVEQAKAALARIERNLERERALLAQNATTAETVRTLEDEGRLARARLTEALTMQGYKSIRAPFDGRITAKEIRRGDLARPGMPLLTLEGIGSLKVHVQVPDSLSMVEYGAGIPVESDGVRVQATLAEWSPAADPESRTRLAKLDLPAEARVRSGQYVRVYWPAETTTYLWIPAAALSKMGQLERVFVVEDGQAQLRLVKTGIHEADRIQILAGLEAGETVILSPGNQLRDGQAVEVES